MEGAKEPGVEHDLEAQLEGPSTLGNDEKDASEKPPPPSDSENVDHLSETRVIPVTETHETDEAQEYDERAVKFWSVYVDEAENHDKALIETWKDDMEGIIIFTCTDPGLLPTEEARRKRARACIDAALSFVLSMDDEWEWFTEPEIMSQTLTYLGDVERIREPPLVGFDSTFAVRWTCMTIIAVRKMLNTSQVQDAARRVISCLADVRGEKDDDRDDIAAKTASIIDRHLKQGWESADVLHEELNREVEPDKIEERFHECMRDHMGHVTTVGDTWNSLGWAGDTDEAIINLLPPHCGSIVAFGLTSVSGQGNARRPWTPHAPVHPPRLLMQRVWLCVWALRGISAAGWGAGAHQPKTLGELSAPEMRIPELRQLMDSTQVPIKAQLWRMQDLRDGGHVFMVELFMAAVRASKVSSHHSSRPLFIGTFKNITSDWKEHRDSPATQRLLVHLLRQILPRDNESPSDEVPAYIIDEFLAFIGNVLAEKKGSHITEAVLLIQAYHELRGGARDATQKALDAISPPKPPKPPRRRRSAARTEPP
ncbi:hypothetical protein BC834DRAFT_843543 [Gloeopeniophorella convolvens]|nr:hypothetical protein BC834DRAFT_843543 [Gloeopeniophorella convolvens]